MSTVTVRSIDALEELQTSLIRYADQAQTTLDAIQREVQATLDWLDERVRHWQGEVRRWQEEERRAWAAYQRCLASGDRDHPPSCGREEQAVVEARRRLTQAEAEARMAGEARQAVRVEAEIYQREASRLRSLLQSDTPKAVETLRYKVTVLRSYTGGVTAGGVAAGALAFGAGLAIGAVLGATSGQEEGDGAEPPTPQRARLKDRFGGDAQALENHYRDALQKVEETNAGQALLRALPQGETLEQLVERNLRGQHVDLLGYVASKCAQGSGELSEASIGTLVHKVAELRTLCLHPDEVLAGIRYAELPIILGEGEARVELDDIIKRGDTYHLRDYKPVNLAKFAASEAGVRWKEYVESTTGEECSRLIAAGRNPFVKGLPKDVHVALSDWLKNQKNQHDAQLLKYKQAFLAAHPALRGDQVRTQVRPYFVYR